MLSRSHFTFATASGAFHYFLTRPFDAHQWTVIPKSFRGLPVSVNFGGWSSNCVHGGKNVCGPHVAGLAREWSVTSGPVLLSVHSWFMDSCPPLDSGGCWVTIEGTGGHWEHYEGFGGSVGVKESTR